MRNMISTTKRRLIPLLSAFVLITGGIGTSLLFTGGIAEAGTCGPVAPAAPTCTMTGTVAVGNGTLTLTAPGALGWSETINGLEQQLVDPTAADQTYTVDDATGISPGWNITASATPFQTAGGVNTLGTATTAGALVPTFATNGSGVGGAMADATAPGSSCEVVGGVASTCTLPTNGTAPVTYPVDITYGQAATGAGPITTSQAPADTIYSADAGTGVGTIVVGTYGASVDATAPNPVGWWVNVPSNTLAGSYVSTITLTLAATP